MFLIRISFCFETVFSHESKIDFLARAKANGYKIILVYIHLFDANLNEARVKQRTSEGGHSVPIEKIHSRIQGEVMRPMFDKKVKGAVQKWKKCCGSWWAAVWAQQADTASVF